MIKTFFLILSIAIVIEMFAWSCDMSVLSKIFKLLCYPFKNRSDYKMEQNCTVPVQREGTILSDMKSIKDFPTITFDQFLDFYYLNPGSWSLRQCRVCKDNNNNLSFTFSYEEWKKYKKWRAQLKKDLDNKNINSYKHDVTKKILEAVQKDIENIRAESQTDLEMAQELMKEVKLK